MSSLPASSAAWQEGGGLRAARGSGGSRYFNAMAGTSTMPAPEVPIVPPSMPIPTSFGFMPMMPG